MSDTKHTVEIKVVDGTKPKGPQAPSTQYAIFYAILLALVFACLGLLDGFIWSIGDLVSKFNGFPCC